MVADDGKHASSVIEVDSSPQGQEEREVWRERARASQKVVADLSRMIDLGRQILRCFSSRFQSSL